MTEIKPIEDACLKLTEARDALTAEAEATKAEIEAVMARRRPAIRRQLRRVKALQQAAHDLAAGNPALFAKPKSRIFGGVRIGWRKQVGQMVIADEAAAIRSLRRQLGDSAETLIKVTEKLNRKALAAQPGQVLRKAGVEIVADSDAPFVDFTDRAIDKMINAWLAKAPDQEADDD